MPRKSTKKPPSLASHALTALIAAALAASATHLLPLLLSSDQRHRTEQAKEANVEVAGEEFHGDDPLPTFVEGIGARSDYVIIGAGPGGLQLGAFMEAAGFSYRIVERGARVGTFWERYPRHGQLISLNKRFTANADAEFNWRHDWNSLLAPATAAGSSSPRFADFSSRLFPARDEYHAYLVAFYTHHRLKVQFGWEVQQVSRHGRDGFLLRGLTSRGRESITCKYLVVATSLSRPVVPKMVGIELAEGYETVDVDEDAYTNQRVLVLGLGNAAFEAASRAQNTAGYVHMVGRSRGGLKQAYSTHYVGDLRAINNNVLDTFFLKSLDTIDVDVDLEERNCSLQRRTLDGRDEISFGCAGDGAGGVGASYRDGYDRVVRCLGWQFDDGIFDETVRPRLNADVGRSLGGKYPAVSETFESVNVKNLFFAGTLAHSLDYKKSAGGFVHGFRYLARTLYRIFGLNHHKRDWEASHELPATVHDVAAAMHRRFQNSSGLYQMFGELCDGVMVKAATATYFEEVPWRFLMNAGAPDDLRWLFTMHMDYGTKGHGGKGDLSFATREVGRAHYSQFLHPILRAFVPGADGLPRLVSEFHILEDLLTTWDVHELHLKPLIEWVGRVYAGDYTTQEEMLLQRFDEVRANLSAEERGSRVHKYDPHYGWFTIEPTIP